MSSSEQHNRKLAAAIKKMGTSLATHKRSTFKPSGAGSRILDEFKARRAAEVSAPLPPLGPSNDKRYEVPADTGPVTKLPARTKAPSA